MKKRMLMFLVALVLVLCPAAVFADNGSTDTQDSPQVTQETKAGWNESRTVYYGEDGKPVTGLFKAPMKGHTINALYYANEKGRVKTKAGIVTVSGDKKRFLYNNVSGDSGFDEVKASDKNAYTYYIGDFDGDCRVVSKSGVYTAPNGYKYYVGSNGTVTRTAGFVDSGSKRYYITKTGHVRTKPGFVWYKDKKYRITSTGTVRTKEGAITVNGKRYVIGKDGAVATKRGVVKANNWLYFVNKVSGELGTNKAYKIGSKVYHVASNGVVKVGRHKWKDGRYYYSVEKGHLKRTDGLLTKNGKRFFVKKGGLIVVNQKFKHNKWFYIAGSNGTIKTGLFKWKGVLYYASEKGALKRYAGIVKYGNYNYYVAAGGRVYVNQMFTSKGKMYAADKDGHLQSGFFKWGGYEYYADTDFSILVNKKFQVSGKTYISDSYGHLKSGRFQWGRYYYFADQNYVVYINKKFNANGNTYVADSDGHLKSGVFDWEGHTYCANDYNRVYVNKKFKYNGNTYVADGEGHLKSGFFSWGGYYYYADSNCKIYVYKKFSINNKTYLTGTTGHLKSGVYTWGGNYYYSDSNYVLDTKEEIIKYNNSYYYNKSGGGLAKKEWVLYEGKHYYAGGSAELLTGSFRIKNVNGDYVEVNPDSDGVISDEDYKKVFEPKAEVIEDGNQN